MEARKSGVDRHAYMWRKPERSVVIDGAELGAPTVTWHVTAWPRRMRAHNFHLYYTQNSINRHKTVVPPPSKQYGSEQLHK